MKNTVYKYDLPAESGDFEISMPAGARIFHVASQGDNGYLWAIVDPLAPNEKRKFVNVVVGSPVPDRAAPYLGTFMHVRQAFHVFELLQKLDRHCYDGPEVTG